MKYHWWQWKCTHIRKLKFMASVTVLTSPTLVCSVFYVVVHPMKFMPWYALWVSYGYSGNLNFAFPDFCVFKGTSFQKWPTKKAPWTGRCAIPCVWNGSEEPPWLGLLWVCFQNHGRWWGLHSLWSVFNPGDRGEVMERKRTGIHCSDYYHLLSTS